jgi:hypothetical protein
MVKKILKAQIENIKNALLQSFTLTMKKTRKSQKLGFAYNSTANYRMLQNGEHFKVKIFSLYTYLKKIQKLRKSRS